MKARKLVLQKTFYKEVEKERKGKRLCYKQKNIFDLNKKCDVEMFSTAVRGGKAFASKQKIKELKKRIFRRKSLKKKLYKKRLKPIDRIQKAVINMKNLLGQKYGVKLDEIEKNLLIFEVHYERFDFHRLEKISDKLVFQER